VTGTALSIALLSVLLNAAAQLFLKAGTNIVGTVSFGDANTFNTLMGIARVPWFWAGFACYGISLFTWIATLSRLPVSPIRWCPSGTSSTRLRRGGCLANRSPCKN
jgi:hypothetical protein